MASDKYSDKRKKSVIMEWIKDIAIAAIIAIIIVQFIKPTIVKETSMEPNFYENNYLFVFKMSYKLGGEPKKGDVIVFKSNLETKDGKKKLLIKRVIGVPGDTVDIKDGEVYLNGKKDNQQYTKDGTTTGRIDNMKVPKGKLFCMGDNRTVSIDSRSDRVGLVKEEDVVGKVVFRLFPFNKIGTIKNPY
mgnify:FL=1